MPTANPCWSPAPGCYPTATSLAAAPAVRAGWVAENGPVIVDAISGVTGAGKSCNARTHFCSADENLEAYGVGKHRHTPEIEQILGLTESRRLYPAPGTAQARTALHGDAAAHAAGYRLPGS